MPEPLALSRSAWRLDGLAMDTRELVRIVRRGWWLVAISVATSALLAVVGMALTKRVYQASAQLLILQQGGRPLNVVNTDPIRLLEGADDFIPTQVSILRSPVLIAQAIDSVGLRNLPSLKPATRGGLSPAQQAIEHLRVTRPDRAARILLIAYEADSKAEAVRMVDAIIQGYQRFLEDSSQKSNNRVVSLITKARDDLKNELAELERKYLDYRQRNPLLTTDETGHSFTSRRLDLWDRASNDAMVKSVQLRSQLELGRKLVRGGAGLWAVAHALGQVGGGAPGELLATSARATQDYSLDYLRQLSQEQQQLTERYGPQYSKVQELRDQISRAQDRTRETRNRLEQGEAKDLLGSIDESLKSIDSMRGEIRKRFDEDLKAAKKTEIDLLTDANLRGNLDRQRSLFNLVVDQLKQAQFVSDFHGVNAQTIEPATAQPAPVRPRLGLSLALALVVGGLLGLVTIVAIDWFDARFRSLGELHGALGLPVLGQIPQPTVESPALTRNAVSQALKAPGSRRERARRVLRLALAFVEREYQNWHVAPVSSAPGPGLSLADAASRSPCGEAGRVTHASPGSPTAESYKAVRTILDFLRRKHQVRVVLVASPSVGDGRSTLASNLAISIAQAGRKVLLVDADLRDPAQDKIHNLRREGGLVEVLKEGQPAQQVLQWSSIENLDVITAGPDIPNPAELLMLPRLGEFLDDARQYYDMVIIDSSPLLNLTDPSIIGSVVDGILLVVRASATRRHDAMRAVDLLKALEAPLLGVLVNGVFRESTTARDAASGVTGSLRTSDQWTLRRRRQMGGRLPEFTVNGQAASIDPALDSPGLSLALSNL